MSGDDCKKGSVYGTTGGQAAHYWCAYIGTSGSLYILVCIYVGTSGTLLVCIIGTSDTP